MASAIHASLLRKIRATTAPPSADTLAALRAMETVQSGRDSRFLNIFHRQFTETGYLLVCLYLLCSLVLNSVSSI